MIMYSTGALAQQQTPARSTTTEPGQVERRLETPRAPLAPSAPVVVPPSAPGPTVEEPARAFTLIAVELDGATVFPPDELADSYERFLGKSITTAEIEQILAAITAKYRDAGYVLSYAVAPPQSVDFGILQIKIIEGYVAEVRFVGGAPGGESVMRSYARKITAERPATLATLERYSLLLSDAPGMTVKPSIRSLPEVGAHEYILTLEHSPVQGSAGLDNRGTHSVGPLQAYASASLNSVLGWFERTRATISTVPDATRELRYGEVFHEEFLDSEGTRGFVSASRSTIDAYSDVFSQKKQGDSTRVSSGITHPLVRARTQNLWVNGRFDAMNSSQSQLDNNFDDRLRVFRVGTQYFVSDGWSGDNLVGVEFSQGVDAFGASEDGGPNLSRAGGRTDFRKLTVELGRQQNFGKQYNMLVQAVGQKSGHTLLSGEEIALGGKRFGRAFDPGEISGKDGAALAVELRHHDSTEWDFITSYQIYTFGDVGAVWNNDRARDALSSTGAGVRLELVPGVVGNIEVAVPLNRRVFAERDDHDSRDPRVFFGLNANF